MWIPWSPGVSPFTWTLTWTMPVESSTSFAQPTVAPVASTNSADARVAPPPATGPVRAPRTATAAPSAAREVTRRRRFRIGRPSSIVSRYITDRYIVTRYSRGGSGDCQEVAWRGLPGIVPAGSATGGRLQSLAMTTTRRWDRAADLPMVVGRRQRPELVALPAEPLTIAELFTFMRDAELRFDTLRM